MMSKVTDVEGVDAVLFLEDRIIYRYLAAIGPLSKCRGWKTTGRLGFCQQSFRKIGL